MTWNIIGHEWAVKLLRGHINNQSLRQAYLFSGPGGIGKKRLAIRFTQAILCQQSPNPGEPCLTCHTCDRVLRLEHPDLFPVSVEEKNTQIRIDQIRELVHSLSLSPYEAKNRLGLLLDMENANVNTQNALLKTLEEPPDPVILILTATSNQALLDTITSRCEEIKLNFVPIPVIKQGLMNLDQISPDRAEFLAHISGGRPEKALDYFHHPDNLELRSTLLDDHFQILQSNSVRRFSYASQVLKNKDQIENLIETWFLLWHDILNQAAGSQAPIRNIDRVDDINKILLSVDLASAQDILGLFRSAQELLSENANPKLTLEDLFLQLPRIN
jgi:DNA polymerase-3 subunit delta'